MQPTLLPVCWQSEGKGNATEKAGRWCEMNAVEMSTRAKHCDVAAHSPCQNINACRRSCRMIHALRQLFLLDRLLVCVCFFIVPRQATSPEARQPHEQQ
eukprot:2994045-Amphidinium_carterae.1